MSADLIVLFCPACGQERLAEIPPCPDGHDDCPDRACVECGTALLLDAALYGLSGVESAPSRSASARSAARHSA